MRRRRPDRRRGVLTPLGGRPSGLSARSPTRRSLAASSPREGFTLVGVVVAIAIIVILLAAVGPTISTLLERDRETELIFRGRQYARAIIAFQKRYGRLPNELKEMAKMKPKTIRQLWKDPMCNCDDWEPIFAGTPDAAPMGQGPAGPGVTPGFGGRRTPTPNMFGDTPSGATPAPGPFQGTNPQRTPTPSSIFGNQGKKVGPIVGVRTKVHRKSIKPWRGRDYTDEWRFIAGDADNDQDLATIMPHVTPPPGTTTSTTSR
jgi:type II secretory pathway pseudopilin PulG